MRFRIAALTGDVYLKNGDCDDTTVITTDLSIVIVNMRMMGGE